MMKMFTKKKSELQDPIDNVLERMKIYDPIDSEYEDLLARLERLEKLKHEEMTRRVSHLTGETAAVAGANLLGIVIMVAYERANVMTSKGLGMLLRTKHH